MFNYTQKTKIQQLKYRERPTTKVLVFLISAS